MRLRSASLLAVLTSLLLPTLLSADARWLQDHAAAQAAAREQGLPILVLFTGSDWCPPCQAMDREVFSDNAFYQWAEGKVVLLKADFPRRQRLAPELAAANEALRNRAPGFRGYPSLYLWNAETDTLTFVSGGYSGNGTHGVTAAIHGKLPAKP